MRSVVVEGISAGGTGGYDRLDHCVSTARYVASGNPQHGHAIRFEPSRPFLIMLWLIAHIMADAINFDSQARLVAVEIENVGPRRMLAPELVTARPQPKPCPQHDLRYAHRAP
jgi:hypothetical protein